MLQPLNSGDIQLPRVSENSQPAEATRLLRVTRALNPYRRILIGAPLRVLVFALLVGVALAIASLYLKVGFFSVDLQILPQRIAVFRNVSLNLGYLTQLNYGPWYFLGCPLVLYCLAMASHLTRATGPDNLRSRAALSILAGHAGFQILGIGILCMFVFKNIEAEVRDLNTLGLGWVQSERVSDWAKQIAQQSKPIDISAYRFFYMDIPKDDASDVLDRVLPKQVLVSAVYPPHLKVSTHFGFLLFVVAVKTWAGFWEGAVVYSSLLAIIWTVLVLRSLRPEDILSLTDEKGSIWAEQPGLWLLATGCLTNVFLISRFCANAAKGSFGLPDQYVSLTTALPGIAAATLGLGVFHAVLTITPGARLYVISKKALVFFGFWALTLTVLLLVILKYNDPTIYRPLRSALCDLPIKVCPIAP